MKGKDLVSIKSIKECNALEDYLSFFENDKQGERHTEYYHYTSADKTDKILNSQSLWLSNLAGTSNDNLEKDWYEKKGKYLFSICFSTGTSESLPLWFLYSGIDGQGARIGFKKNQLIELYKNTEYKLIRVSNSDKKLVEEIAKLEKADFTVKLNDILYIGKDTVNSGKYRIKHNGNTNNDISEEIYSDLKTRYGAFTKGLIWFYEKETRLQVEITNKKYKNIIDESINGKENFITVAMSLKPANYNFSVKLAPNCDEKEKGKFCEWEGFKNYAKSKIELSDYKKEINMELKKRLCESCNLKKREGIKLKQKDLSLRATEEFISFLGLNNKFMFFKVKAKITDSQEELICDSVCECRFSDDIRYENREISIEYEFNDSVMHSLNLHGAYNTTFQVFSFKNGIFKIIDSDNDRILNLERI